jgi:hypothetical protein
MSPGRTSLSELAIPVIVRVESKSPDAPMSRAASARLIE